MATSGYTTQNDLLLNNLMDFYKNEENLNTMLKIITGESKISLRIVDWQQIMLKSTILYIILKIPMGSCGDSRFMLIISLN